MAKPLTLDRVLPNSLDAEKNVLGCMLLDAAKCGSEAMSRLEKDHFYFSGHQVLFEEFCEMTDANQPVDSATMSQWLSDKGRLEEIGGPVYLFDLVAAVVTTSTLDYHIDTVLEKHTLRQLIGAAHDVISRSFEQQDDVKTWLAEVQQVFFDIGVHSSSMGSRTIQELVKGTMLRIDEWHVNPGQVVGVATGFSDIDRILGGLRPGQMIVLAGRPGHGKSSLSANIIENTAIAGNGVGWFSLEMTAEELSDRAVTSAAHVSLRVIQAGRGKADDFERLLQSSEKLLKTNIHIDDTAALTIQQIRSRARRMKRKYDIKLAVIDYMQLAHGTKRNGKREEEVAEVSQGTKAMAKELGIPVIAVCQLNRQAEGADLTPRLSWLRESGAIEQDADVVGFLVRPELFAAENMREELKGQAVLTIAKQRNGPTGDIDLTFLPEFTRFRDRAKIDDGDVPVEAQYARTES